MYYYRSNNTKNTLAISRNEMPTNATSFGMVQVLLDSFSITGSYTKSTMTDMTWDFPIEVNGNILKTALIRLGCEFKEIEFSI